MASSNNELHTRRPKHFVNDPNKVLYYINSYQGLCLSYPSLRFIEKEKIVYRADIDDIRKKHVTLISGGGAGHEPTHAAFVGPRLLSAAVSGNIFASPSTSQILAAIRRVESTHGTLLIVKNYTGDCLNFGLAAEKAKAEGIKVELIVVGDDVGVGRQQGGLVGRRGLAGTILVHKVAGAMAAKGASLEEVKNAALLVAENIGTIGVAFDRCTIPGTTQGSSLPDDVIELGMGIHGEPGFQKISLPPSRKLVQKMLDTIITQDADRSFLDIKPEKDQIALLINNLGGISTLELYVVVNDALSYLVEKKFYIKRVYVGHFMTSLNMPGVSLSILRLPKNLDVVPLLDKSAEAPGWINHIKVDISNLDSSLDEKISHSNVKKKEEKLFIVNVDPQLFESTIKAACNALIQAEPEITKYDTIVGDGDCGITLKYGATDILAALEEGQIVTNDLSEGLMKISNFLEARGGTSGFLYCALSNSLRYFVEAKMKEDISIKKNQIIVDGECFGASLKSALSTLQNYTPARKGDRTMMDVIIPFITTFTDTYSTDNNTLSAFKDAIEAAKTGAEYTKGLKPRLGRSTYIDENIIKEARVPDPGAWAAYVILNGIYVDFV
ncbi:10526_t:CDS:10 [Funneliformis geosporum]|uniref:10304_t:CDS:1 n=1 Tax=Funneliformis geosporum TaxID=1117311 RepID=A0A9W4WW44_9GLOM|nr:10526_t:CDS:10 [Funneliformis geosporum]CAI2176525.1 10304_t:CDS:10 [Funneliformis geosporum]